MTNTQFKRLTVGPRIAALLPSPGTSTDDLSAGAPHPAVGRALASACTPRIRFGSTTAGRLQPETYHFYVRSGTQTQRLSSVNGLFPDGDASHGPIGARLLGCGPRKPLERFLK